MRTFRSFSAALAVCAATLALPAAAEAGPLSAGAGKADITPQTGYYLGGWTRADRVAQGQHTRLYARALVLERDGRKVALVAADLFMVTGGLVKHAAEAAGRGFNEQNVLISASHTHSGPGGFANFKTFNTAAPSLQTATDPLSFYFLLDPKPADPALYSFLVRRIATAIRRADANRGRATAGWGTAQIRGLTQNRSVEAHLASHGIMREFGEGEQGLDPAGIDHTIDPDVNVLRVDKLVRACRASRRRVARGRRPAFAGQACRTVRRPIGAWSNFADHGTVTKSSFQYYNQDHHGSALRVFEDGVRRAAKVPRRQPVVNVYGNGNEGDQSAGLVRHGPAASDYVGRVEAAAMLRAWRRARGALTTDPRLDLRWTRQCFCGQEADGGNVADYPMIGFPFLTGSEEERGPLYDVTGTPLEGRRNPLPVPGQGHKQGIPLSSDSVPKAVPLMAVRVGDRLIVSMPGEPTADVGRRIKAAVFDASSGAGVSRVVLAGLANEFIQYFTTPEEYDRQHYEGGSTLYGPLSAPFLQGQLTELARRLVGGQPAQDAYSFDPTNGVSPDGPAYGDGAERGSIAAQPPGRVARLGHATFAWNGGRLGLDRPLDRPFVSIQRRSRRRWRTAATDLGLAILWSVDDSGLYRLKWEVPLSARRGIYRIVISAKQYRLVSRRFHVSATSALRLRQVPTRAGRIAVAIDYPLPVRDQDLTHRPRSARGGVVSFRIGSRRVRVRRRRGSVFSVGVRPGRRVVVPPGAARDRYGNVVGVRAAFP